MKLFPFFMLMILKTTLSIAESKQTVWVDTDIACGISPSSDVDDCLALTYLLLRDDVRVVGISSIFGNADESRVIEKLTEFLKVFKSSYPDRSVPPVYQGAKERKTRYGIPVSSPASAAMIDYFSQNPGMVLLLGPATNLASALSGLGESKHNISKVLYIGGKETEGRRFFPDQDSKLISFRDFNLAKDPYSFEDIFQSDVSLHLSGYKAASQHLFHPKKLSQFNLKNPLKSYMEINIQQWQQYWVNNFKIDGFYPFDYIAVKSVFEPSKHNCRVVLGQLKKFTFLFWSVIKRIAINSGNRRVVFCNN